MYRYELFTNKQKAMFWLSVQKKKPNFVRYSWFPLKDGRIHVGCTFEDIEDPVEVAYYYEPSKVIREKVSRKTLEFLQTRSKCTILSVKE